MADNFWEQDAAVDTAGAGAAPRAESTSTDWWKADKPAEQGDLPKGVKASVAGAGRGRVNPPMPREPQPDLPQGDPMGTGFAEIANQPPKRESVLEGVDLPEPTITPAVQAENDRLSRRDYAERTPTVDDPRNTAPSMRSGELAPDNPNIGRGRELADASLPVRAAVKTVTQGVQGLAGTVRAAADVAGVKPVSQFAENASRNAEAFEQGMGRSKPVEGFGPSSPVPYLKDMAEGATSSLLQSAGFATALGPRAVIPLMTIQQSGQTYNDARSAGKSPAEALAYAIPYGAFEAIGEKYQGLDKAAEALKVLMTKGAPRAAVRSAGEALLSAGVREVPGEVITYLGQSGMDALPGIGLRQDMTVGDWLNGLRDTVVQAAMMGGTEAAGGAHAARAAGEQQQPSAEEIARAKGFLAQQDRIKQLNAAGEKEVAGTLERRLNAEMADGELEAMKGKPYADDPDFQQRYRTMRAAGVKPVEASARAAMVSGFSQIGQQAGLTPKAIEAAVEAAGKMPLEKVSGFFERYTSKLTQGGMGKALPAGTMGGAVDAVGNDAMNTALQHHDRNTAAAQAVANMEKLLGGTKPPAADAGSVPATPQEEATAGTPAAQQETPDVPALDHGNDVLVTPEADAVHAAATSPLNDLPEPTQAQKDAGNYKVGRLRIGGLDISVENPQGSVRRGVDADGNPWETPLQDHYGYVRGTVGADKDHLDVFVKPGTPADYRGPVFVVDQIDPKTGRFDEHKVVIGAADQAEAEQVYRRNYSAGWNGMGAVTQLPMPAFQAWARSGKTKEPLGDLSHIQPAAEQPAAQAAAPAQPADRAGAPPADGSAGAGVLGEAGNGAGAAPISAVTPDAQAQRRDFAAADKVRRERAARLRSAAFDKNPLMAFLAKHGVSLELAREFAPGPKERRSAIVPGYGPVFRRAGLNVDLLAQRAAEEGFLPPGSTDANALYDLMARAFRGERVAPVYAEGVAEEEMRRRADDQSEPPQEGEVAAVEALADLSDNELEAVADLVDDVPDLDAGSNTSLEAAMRSMGFTDQEISDAVAEESRRQEANRARGGGAAEAAQGAAQAGAAGREGEAPAAEVGAANTQTETPAPAGVSASGDGFPPVTQFDRINVGPGGYIKPRSVAPGQPTYRETNVDGLVDRMREDRQAVPFSGFVADRPELALGQGENRGVQLVFRPDSVSGREHAKPMTGDLAGREYRTDLLAPRAVQAVTIWPADLKRARPIARQRLAAEFDRETLPDGRLHFTRKGLPKVAALPIEGITFKRNASGTVSVTGDEATIRRILENAGVTRVLRSKDALLVGKTQADKAVEVLAKLAPQEDQVLTAPTEQDVLEQQERRAAGERAVAKRRQDEETRAAADAARGDFTLTGSDRAADANPAQRDLLAPATAQADTNFADAMRKAGLTERVGGADADWRLVVSGLGDVLVKVDGTQEGEPRATVVAEYMGKNLGERKAIGLPAILEAINTARDGIQKGREKLAADVVAKERGLPKAQAESIQDLGEKIGGARKDTATPSGRSRRAQADDGRPTWAKRFTISQVVKGDGEGRWAINDTRSTDWTGQPRQVGRQTFASKEEAEAFLPVAAVALKHRAVPTRDGKYEIWRDITERKRVKVVDREFDTRDDAMAYMAQHAAQILETNTTFGEADLPLPPDRARTGPERRQGDVKGEDFRSAFGFRGVEFGNWNNQEERQALMNEAYDGLMDLADVLGVPPKALGLNGDLALAFGARGHGLNSARAHYEPERAVINLTKENGAGSLAHEWFHGLDFYFGRQDGKASSQWIVGKDGTRTLKADVADAASHGFRRDSGVRPEVRAAYEHLIQTMSKKATQYVEDTVRADNFTGRAREDLARELEALRKELAAQKDPAYYKRNNKPATAQQLADFDAIAKRMLDGEAQAITTDWRTVETAQKKIASRWTNDSLEQLGAIYKAVRGRSGFDTQNRNGTMDRLASSMRRYGDRLKLLAEAQSGTEKTRMVPTDFAMNAKELDQGRGGDYWTTAHEMAARAFQAYVEDRVAEQGGVSRFLNYAPENAGILTPWGFKRPYPAGAERVAINRAMDAFVKSLKTEATDQGVRLYAREQGAQRRGDERMPSGLTLDEARAQIRAMRGASVADAQKIVADLTKTWKDGPKISVVATTSELPGDNHPSDVRGLYTPGHIWIVAGAHRNGADLRRTIARTLAHEAVAHFGLRHMLGREGWNSLMGNIRRAIAAGNKPLSEIQTYVRRTYANADGSYTLHPDAEADEIAARAIELAIAEDGSFKPGFGFFKAAWSRVAEFLRGLGLDVAFTSHELQGMLVRSMRNLEVGRKTAGRAQVVVAAAREDVARARGADAFDGAQHARAATVDEQQDEAAPAQVPRPLSRWRDATGRLQFAPGQALYDLIGKAADPLLSALQLKAASTPLRRALREMKNEVRKAQETAAAVAGETNKLTPAERAMVSDLVEKELAAGTVPPEHAVRLATLINDVMGKQTDELVRLGMLEKDAAEKWRGQYLPRYYESKLTRKAADAWADAVRRITGRPRLMRGISGKHLKGRGLYETIPESQLQHYEALGWEVRDPDYTPGLPSMDGTVQVWRDFTRAERDKMGEIRDAGFRFVMGYMQTQRDVALGRMFEGLAADPTISSRTATEQFTVQVPTSTVAGTGAKTYGKLAGRWVSKDTLSHLSAIEEAQSEAMQMYRKAMGIWKEGKTALNPVSHMNNVLSNLTMAHLAGISYWEGHKYVAAARDLATKADMVTEAKDAGLFGGTLSEVELMNMLPPELAKLARTQETTATKVGRTAFNVMTFYLRRPMGWAYQAEDSFFRYLIYRDARAHGMQPQDAVDYAQRFIFAYDDLPKGARRIRDFGIPFFSYTFKAAPALLHTALTHPLRMAAPSAVLWAANAVAYAIAVGDPDDDWEEKLRKYLTDAEYRRKARELEQLEMEHLPPWMKGYTSLLTPKTMRLGMDEVTKLPLFIDMSRVVPGGDLFDVSPNSGGLPIPQPITPSHPLFTTAVAMFGNKDLFFGKDIVDSNDTTGEAARKRAAWLWMQLTPAITAGNYHWQRGMNALAQATGHEVRWLPEEVAPEAEATGIGRDSLPVQPKYAAMQTFGLKVRPIDIDTSIAIEESLRKKMIRDIDTELRAMKRLYNKGAISDSAYDSAADLAATKKERLKEGLSVDGTPP